MGYTVQLLRGEVVILAADQQDAMEAIKALDRDRADLKSGWHRLETGEQEPHWAFVSEDLQTTEDFDSMLRALRFDPVFTPDGDLIGVVLEGCSRSRGDELHFWKAMAPFVQPGGEMDWYGEDDAVWRWRFDGRDLEVVSGTLRFGDA